jgi:ribosome-associated protein
MSQDSPTSTDSTISKSQRKREAHALFDLGRELVNLNAKALAGLPLDPALRAAVDEARGIKSHVAHKRQLQYIARVLRGMDCEPIRAALGALRSAARQLTAQHHRAEAWRDRLLGEGDTALQELIESHGLTDAQTLRQLVRNAQREARLSKPPAAARKLFRLLRELDARQPLPPP